MLTDYYAVWQPTKVNTGASFNLLQSPSFPCWARLRCTGLLAEPWLQRASSRPGDILSLPTEGCSPPLRFSGVGHEQRDRRQPREGTEGDRPHVVLPKHPAAGPSCLYCGHKVHRLLHSRLRSNLPARCTDLPAGRAGPAGGELGQVFLPALPRMQESAQLLES